MTRSQRPGSTGWALTRPSAPAGCPAGNGPSWRWPWAGERPELLVLDEPVASLDPLARREFLQRLMASVAEQEPSVMLSSHLVSDLERVCDYVVVLVDARVRVEGDVEDSSTLTSGSPGPPLDRALPVDRGRLRAPHRPAEHAGRPHRGPRSSTPRGPSRRSGWRTLVLSYMDHRLGQHDPGAGGAAVIWPTCGSSASRPHGGGRRRAGVGRARRDRAPARRPRGGRCRPGLRPAHPD